MLSLSCLNILADKIILLKQSSWGNLHLGHFLTRERPLGTSPGVSPGICLPLALNIFSLYRHNSPWVRMNFLPGPCLVGGCTPVYLGAS